MPRRLITYDDMKRMKHIAIILFISLLLSSCAESPEAMNARLNKLQSEAIKTPKDIAPLEKIIELTKDSNSLMRVNALSTLLELRHTHEEHIDSKIVPTLLVGLKDEKQSVRRFAASAFKRIPEYAKPAIPALIKGLREGNNDVAWFSADALGGIGAEAKEAVPTLIEVLKVDYPEHGDYATMLRIHAVEALGDIGPDAKTALPELEKYKDSSDSVVRKKVAQAIELIAGAEQGSGDN